MTFHAAPDITVSFLRFRKNFRLRLCISLTTLCVVLPSVVVSQTPRKALRLTVIPADSISHQEWKNIKKLLPAPESFKDSVSLVQSLAETVSRLQISGYPESSFDSIDFRSSDVTALLYSGGYYAWATLEKGNVDDAYLPGTKLRQKLFRKKTFNYKQVQQLKETILTNCENNGYPFASVGLHDIRIEDGMVSAKMNLEKGKFVQIDSVSIKGNATIAPGYIYNYTGIWPGDMYNEALISKISNRIRELPFVREIRPYRVLFSEKDTKLELFLENRKASQFDGVIGLLPDEGKTGKLNVTGDAHLKIQNGLKRGEVIELNWKQLPVRTQDLKIHGYYPYLFNTPFGIDANLNLYKKDTLYTDVLKNLGVQYNFDGNTYIKAFVTEKESDLQSTAGLENITVLPSYADISMTSYGFTVHIEKTDYRLNPRKGFNAEGTGSAGTRKIHKNSGVNPEVYDSLKLSYNTYHGEASFDFYYSPGGRHVFDIGGIGGYMYNPEAFVNELFRIGGLRSLRGFDEESIYASSFTIGKIEYRYLLEQNSFLFLFYNQAWYETRRKNYYLRDTPLGFGAGINFEIKLGIMSVSYALGKQFGNPVLFRSGKVHFGIVNYF